MNTRLTSALLCLLLTNYVLCKIVLPHKLRYLENMLNAEVVAKAARIRQRLGANPDQDGEKSWPLLLANYQDLEKPAPPRPYSNLYGQRLAHF